LTKVLEAFGKTLRQLRIERGISQKELARVFGMQRTAITNYETGKSLPNLELFVEIVKYFDVSCDFLLGFPSPAQVEHLKPKQSDLDLSNSPYAWSGEPGPLPRTPEEQARIARLECRLDILLEMAGTLSAEVQDLRAGKP
jgi:transcriptional regulator with XRE-family HTH domain